MQLDIDIEDWPSGEWETLATRAAASDGEPLLAKPRLALSLLFTSDAEVHALNREWRSRDKPANVLSFPMLERAELEALSPDGPPEMLGNIALAYETCAREAADKGTEPAFCVRRSCGHPAGAAEFEGSGEFRKYARSQFLSELS